MEPRHYAYVYSHVGELMGGSIMAKRNTRTFRADEIEGFISQLQRVDQLFQEYREACADLTLLMDPRISRYMRDGRALIREIDRRRDDSWDLP